MWTNNKLYRFTTNRAKFYVINRQSYLQKFKISITIEDTLHKITFQYDDYNVKHFSVTKGSERYNLK